MNKDSVASTFDNPLWKSFYIPKDKITTRFIEVLNNIPIYLLPFIMIRTLSRVMDYHY